MVDDPKGRDRKAGAAGLTRRDFIKAGAAAGAGLAVSKLAFVRDVHAVDAINVVLIGNGKQGQWLMKAMLKIPDVRFRAVCDIWSYSQEYASGILRKSKQPPANIYEDYREMLAAEKDLDAAVIATPDWVHAPQTVACLEAGLHVYCEKEMSNSLEECRSMVRAARKTGKLLQIGHQRRSNPRYVRAFEGITKRDILGRITHCYGQWNRGQRMEANIPAKYIIDDATLRKYGYDTMERFRNWRWYRKFSGGAIADLGSHQVDVFSWFLGSDPVAVMATGGLDYYRDKEWYDNVTALYEYRTAKGTARGLYQVLSTTSYRGYYEVFMGDKMTLEISEDTRIGSFHPEPAKEQPEWVKPGAIPKVGESRDASGKPTPQALKAQADAKKPVHQPHLENFFDAVRGKAKLTCPAEVAFRTAVPILRTNEAVESARRVELTEEDYRA